MSSLIMIPTNFEELKVHIFHLKHKCIAQLVLANEIQFWGTIISENRDEAG